MSLKDEFAFRTSRSGGKGGQHTNKRETKVTLVFDIEASHHLSNAQKSRVKNNLSHRINKRGKLLITSQESRSQWGNKKIVKKRFYKLLFQALQPQPTRKPTQPSAASKRRQRRREKRHSQKKQRRRKDNSTLEWLREMDRHHR